MTKPVKSTLSKWIFWQPLNFSISFFLSTFFITFIYIAISSAFSDTLYPAPLLVLLTLAFIYCITRMIKKSPSTEMTQLNFIGIHNAQKIIYFLGMSSSLILLLNYTIIDINTFLFSQHWLLTLVYASLLALFLLYIIGTGIYNIYVKFCRIRSLGIPTHKIFLSMPFGFSALWIPGYFILETKKQKKAQLTESKWYNKFNEWIISNQTNCILSFLFITILTELLLSFETTILKITLAIFFGIWVLQTGLKKFKLNMNKAYTNIAIVINIILILALIFFSSSISNVAPDVQINIQETTIITQGEI